MLGCPVSDKSRGTGRTANADQKERGAATIDDFCDAWRCSTPVRLAHQWYTPRHSRHIVWNVPV